MCHMSCEVHKLPCDYRFKHFWSAAVSSFQICSVLTFCFISDWKLMDEMCEICEGPSTEHVQGLKYTNHMDRSAGDMNAIKEEMSEKQLACGRSACQIIISQCVGHFFNHCWNQLQKMLTNGFIISATTDKNYFRFLLSSQLSTCRKLHQH